MSAFKILLHLYFLEIQLWCLGVDFFEFILLRFTQLLEPIVCVLPNLGSFQLLFLPILHVFSFPSGTPMKCTLDLLLLSHRSLRLNSFYFSVRFFSFVQTGSILLKSSSSVILSSVSSTLLLNPSSELFI